MDLLANAQFKTKEDARNSKFPPVQKAYNLLESASLPEKIKQEDEESMKRRFQISHYIDHEKGKSQKEVKKETMGLRTKEIESLHYNTK